MRDGEVIGKHLTPELIAKLGRLDLRARTVVEGFLSGLHRSSYKGFSVEFAEHRPYFPGDDVRHIDWKAYAKSDRLYVKEFEEETNLRCYLLVDASASMGYGTTGMSKYECASVVAAAIAYLALQQRDSVGLVVFSEDVLQYIPPRMHPSHFTNIVEALEATKASGGTNAGNAIKELGERLKRRGLVVLLSDLIDSDDSFRRALCFLRHRKHEVIVFHMLDPAEIELTFEEPSVFWDLEERRSLQTDPVALRSSYRREVANFISNCREMCYSSHVDYVFLRTDEPFDTPLMTYLSWRSKQRHKLHATFNFETQSR